MNGKVSECPMIGTNVRQPTVTHFPGNRLLTGCSTPPDGMRRLPSFGFADWSDLVTRSHLSSGKIPPEPTTRRW